MSLTSFSEAVIDTFERLQKWNGPIPGFFRFMTLMAFDQMIRAYRKGVLDVAILEVGMGGLYDATNVIEDPQVTAIASIAMEHVKSLGPTMGDIAFHKAGIAKKNVPLISVPQPVEAVEVIAKTAGSVGAKLEFVESLSQELPNSLNINLDGSHQYINAALAVRIVRRWWEGNGTQHNTQEDVIAAALRNTFWPGRHQVYHTGNCSWYLDGAHTVESIKYSLKWFRSHRSRLRKSILAFHVSHDRPFDKLLEPILLVRDLFDEVYFVKPTSPMDTIEQQNDMLLHEQMVDYWKRLTGQTATPITTTAFCGTIQSAQILVVGSLYLVGDVMRILNAPVFSGRGDENIESSRI
ncbi:Folylpolyglutamate synthase [Paramicrosporidium saccamoebae]|uniref:tetrahydrofolate synthase n=1 Tax=Paramicrosporidium saccamoebae TaxID=1246581 RepID=A0A2H9TGN3_9FUNG|nr:Folylpolyglutamate synthase [Paramicrosporidium saccamoebae]